MTISRRRFVGLSSAAAAVLAFGVTRAVAGVSGTNPVARTAHPPSGPFHGLTVVAGPDASVRTSRIVERLQGIQGEFYDRGRNAHEALSVAAGGESFTREIATADLMGSVLTCDGSREGIRNAMRLDPDVLVLEDLGMPERVAVRASMIGHGVVCGVEAASAAEARAAILAELPEWALGGDGATVGSVLNLMAEFEGEPFEIPIRPPERTGTRT